MAVRVGMFVPILPSNNGGRFRDFRAGLVLTNFSV